MKIDLNLTEVCDRRGDQNRPFRQG